MDKIIQGEIGLEITLNSFTGSDRYLINSFGGSLFEGLAIYDFVKGQQIEVGCIGVAASAATLPLIASPNSWGTPNSRYLIHNPGAFADGIASDLEHAADELKKEQARAVELYASHLNLSREEIQTLMNQERFITAQEALTIGIIKEIKEFSKTESVKPDADLKLLYNQFKMKIEMSETVTKADVTRLESLILGIKDLFKPAAPKMIVLTASDGTSIDFGEIMTEEEIAVGVKATIESNPAEGSFVMPDGRTLVFVGGELTEIVEAVDTEEMQKENEELKAQIAELQTANEVMKVDLEEKTTMVANLKENFEKVEKEFTTFKTRFSATKPVINTPPASGGGSKKFTFKRK